MDKVRELWPFDQICLLEFDMNIHPQLEFSQSDDYSSLDLMVKLTRGSPDYLCTVWVQSSLYFLRKGFILILPGPLLNNVYVLGWWSYMDSRLTQKKKENFASNDYFVHFPTYVKTLSWHGGHLLLWIDK